MSRRMSQYQIRKLERQLATTGARELRHRITVAQGRVNRRIANAAKDPKAATSKRVRDKLEADVAMIYASLSQDFDKWLGDVIKTGGPAWSGEVGRDIMQQTGRKLPLMRFDRERVNRYHELINQANQEHLAAVFTRNMTDQAIRNLRRSTVDTFRQAQIEGWTANETQRRLQDAWDRLSGDKAGMRFVDRSGRQWSNSRYLQMLTRTTVQRVSREIQIDTLAGAGFKYGQISIDASDPCPICEAWEGVIIQLAGSGIGGGRYPTYQQALDAGMFHPNCVHRVEYIDEDLEGDEIQRQNEEPAPDAWDNPDAVLDYRNRIEIHRYRDQGMNEQEATRAVMRDRLKRRAQSGMISNRFEDAIDAIPDRVLDQMDLNKLPHFRYMKSDEDHAYSRNSSRGGWIVLDRDAGSEDGGRAAFDKAFYSLETKRGVEVAERKEDNPPREGSIPARNALIASAKNAGYSQSVIDQIAKTPDVVFEKMPDIPRLVPGKSALYRPNQHAIEMPTNDKTWHGQKHVFDHELGHALHYKTRAIVGSSIDNDLKSAIESDYAAWKKKAKTERGENWTQYYGKSSPMHINDLSKGLGAESYWKAGEDVQHRVSGYVDSIGGMSKGRYGTGHSVSYYKRAGGVQGYMEVYANNYRAIVNDWKEYEELMPLTSKWIRSSIGL